MNSATWRTNSLRWSRLHHSIHSSEISADFPPPKPPPRWPSVYLWTFKNKLKTKYFPSFKLSLIWLLGLFTNGFAFNNDNGLESWKRKKRQQHIFLWPILPQPDLVFLDILKMAIWNWILNIGVSGKYSSLGKSDSTERISIECCSGIFGTFPVHYSEMHCNGILVKCSAMVSWGTFWKFSASRTVEPQSYNCRRGINLGRGELLPSKFVSKYLSQWNYV